MADGTGRLSLAYRHPDRQVEAVRFAICEAELIQAIGRGRGVRRDEHNPLDVLLLTDVPLPLPVTILTTWRDLCDGAGPLEVLAARGVIPLDYRGIATTLPRWFKNARAVTDWFEYRPGAAVRFRALRAKAEKAERVVMGECVGIPYKNILIGNSNTFTTFRYRRAKVGRANLVLVDTSMHPDARAAVEAVLGPVNLSPSV